MTDQGIKREVVIKAPAAMFLPKHFPDRGIPVRQIGPHVEDAIYNSGPGAVLTATASRDPEVLFSEEVDCVATHVETAYEGGFGSLIEAFGFAEPRNRIADQRANWMLALRNGHESGSPSGELVAAGNPLTIVVLVTQDSFEEQCTEFVSIVIEDCRVLASERDGTGGWLVMGSAGAIRGSRRVVCWEEAECL